MNINSLGTNIPPIKRPENVETIKEQFLDKLFNGCDTKKSLKEATHAVCDIYIDQFCAQQGIENSEELNENEIPKSKGIGDLVKGFFFIDNITQFFENSLNK